MSVKRMIKQIVTLFKMPYYSFRGNKINVTSYIGDRTFMRKCNVGKWCYIGSNGTFNNTVFGNYSCIAPSTQIGGMEHSYWALSISPHLSEECVSGNTTYIGHDVWVAANCIIKQGIVIGNGAVIGAHSFVNKDVPPYAIVFGSPAKVYKYRFDKNVIQKLEESRYWEENPEKAKKILKDLKVNLDKK